MLHSMPPSYRNIERMPVEVIWSVTPRSGKTADLVMALHVGTGEQALSNALNLSRIFSSLRRSGHEALLEDITNSMPDPHRMFEYALLNGVYSQGMVLPVADQMRLSGVSRPPMTTFDLERFLFGSERRAEPRTIALLHEYVLTYHPNFK